MNTTQPLNESRHTPAQWTLLIVSIAIGLGLISYITYDHLVTGDTPPVITVHPNAGSIRKSGERYFMDINVQNQGDRVAEEVFIRVRVPAISNGQPEEADVRIDFLPGKDQQTHTISFSKEPSPNSITYTAGFLKP